LKYCTHNKSPVSGKDNRYNGRPGTLTGSAFTKNIVKKIIKEEKVVLQKCCSKKYQFVV
jgi:hypothetical protein